MHAWLKLVVAAVVLTAGSALARDTKYILKIADVLAMPEAQGRLDPKIILYFGNLPAPAGESRGEVVVNPKTSGFGKSDEQACRWVMLTALIDLQARARAVGANSVVGIVSFYKKRVFSSESEYECHAGAAVSVVTLKGQIVKTP